MDTRIRPVPALYCCYLLRSTIRHSSLYVGSTPHPSRRTAQHNGKVKGGAVRTARSNLRPWEMVCIVNGFPSNIAALQFEWAWQNPHLTRHISPEARLTLPTTRTKVDSKTGRTRKRPGRPRTSLIDKISNLHLLLRAPYFSHWPLELRFFSADVHKTWLSWSERVDGHIKPHIGVVLDLPLQHTGQGDIHSSQQPATRKKADLIGRGGIEGLDPSYTRFKDVLQKLNEYLQDRVYDPRCYICRCSIDTKTALFSICLHSGCRTLTHISCLSTRFLEEERSQALVPVEGKCPSCKSTQRWVDLMRVMSLRIRGENEVDKLMKKRKTGPIVSASQATDEHTISDDEIPDSDLELIENGVIDEDQVENDFDNDNVSVSSIESLHTSQPLGPRTAAAQSIANFLEIVIEDSEGE